MRTHNIKMSRRNLILPVTLLAVALSAFFVVERAAAQHMDAHHHSPVADVRANRKARDDAWVRWKGILAKL